MPRYSIKRGTCLLEQRSVPWSFAISSQTTSFNRFIEAYPPSHTQSDSLDESWRLLEVPGAKTFFEENSGCTFGRGIYRLLLSDEVSKWNRLVLDIFGQFNGRIECFASDWMGRIFAFDFDRQKVVLLDPGFAEALKMPCDFVELHNLEFVDFPDESLSKDLHERFLQIHPAGIDRKQCVGYSISPFLGGKDELENLGIFDLEVYWSICSDIYRKIKA